MDEWWRACVGCMGLKSVLGEGDKPGETGLPMGEELLMRRSCGEPGTTLKSVGSSFSVVKPVLMIADVSAI